jgi:hypothetical protein
LRVSRDKERTRKPSTKVAATRVKSNLRRKKSCVGGVRRGGQSDVVRQIFSSIVTRFHHASYFLIPHLIPMGETCIFYYYFHCSRSITGGKESREELEECLQTYAAAEVLVGQTTPFPPAWAEEGEVRLE